MSASGKALLQGTTVTLKVGYFRVTFDSQTHIPCSSLSPFSPYPATRVLLKKMHPQLTRKYTNTPAAADNRITQKLLGVMPELLINGER
jgi:hypothetical protein